MKRPRTNNKGIRVAYRRDKKPVTFSFNTSVDGAEARNAMYNSYKHTGTGTGTPKNSEGSESDEELKSE